MPWRTLRASIDLLLSSPCRDVNLVFLGGEPLLELELLRRGIVYAREHHSERQHVRTTVLTNGVLVTDEVAGLLAGEGVDTHLSLDGIRSAQDERQRGTFDGLDRLLDRLRERWPRFFRQNLTVAATIAPGNVRHLADSFDYFMDKDVRRIALSPIITPSPEWRPRDIEELDRQFSLVVRSSVRHHERTGRTPLAFLGDSARPTTRGSETMMCGILPNDSPGVDVDGWVYACPVFAGSYLRPTNPLMREAVRTMRIARLTDRDFAERYRAFPAAVAHRRMFTHRERKYSGYRRCATCPHLEACLVCPAAVAHGGGDPDRIPDFYCAYSFVALEHARSLPVATGPRDLIRGRAFQEARARWGGAAEAARTARAARQEVGGAE
jgi:sulfatase maturation enzyme AslB (radical SAM superfamily)